MKADGSSSLPNDVYLSEDGTCRDLLTRASAMTLNILPSKDKYRQSKIAMPDWTYGIWLSIDANRFYINETEIVMKINDNLKTLQIVQSKQQHEYSIRLRAKSLEQW
jgi:hypothetical protein